ncbi:MAG: histidine phosphotransferase [Paracoccaceae bacterium]|nr:MAG: histidine phosphotransferase [Paracoccaceae bacterium]
MRDDATEDPSASQPANDTDLAALIGSRICHDLISPIGAIGNGVELLMMESGTKSPEVALIADSVAQANARVRFFRVAFGAASAGQRIGRSEIVQVLADLTRGGRIVTRWQSPADLSRPEAKLACLVIMACETALPFGGRITVTLDDDGRWLAMAEGARLRVDPELWRGLTQGSGPVPAPAHVHFALIPLAADRVGRQLTVEISDTAIRIAF